MDFSKIKVVELASVLAGPAVGTFFAELGAEVIKIENKRSNGDVTRGWKLKGEEDRSVSAYYASVNHSKNSIIADFNNPEDLEKIKAKIRTATFVISNFKVGSATKFGLDFTSLCALNPSIISGEITGYPNSDRAAFDVVLQAETGFLSMSGTAAGELVKMPVALIDVLAAHQLKEGLLLAYLQQLSDGKAKRVQVSLYESALASLMNQGSNFLMANHIPKPMGTGHPNIAPYGDLVTTKDRVKLVLAVGAEIHFTKLCKVLGLIAAENLEKFESNAQRVMYREDLMQILRDAFSRFSAAEILPAMNQAGIPYGLVKNMEEVFRNSEARAGIIETTEEGELTKRYRHNVFKISSGA
jgi:crotonobetainyl-CoA:carnitine CoA-transferase CaiB-like acyl-CoA transferase